MNDSEDKLLEAKLGDMADRCERYGCPVYSSFLDEHECVVAEKWCGGLSSDFGWILNGGFADARRKMLAVYPIYCSLPDEDDFPMKCLTFTYRKEDKLTHRDFLGSFMGQRLKREVIGDIIVSEGETQTFVTEVAAKAILDSVTKIGRVGVKITDDVDFRLDAEQKYKEISGTVASLRLDCIVSLAANLHVLLVKEILPVALCYVNVVRTLFGDRIVQHLDIVGLYLSALENSIFIAVVARHIEAVGAAENEREIADIVAAVGLL